MPRPMIDITGQRFGRLTVLHRDTRENDSHAWWVCLCDCGNKKIAYGAHLKSGSTRSCGCLNKERSQSRKGVMTAKSLVGNRFGRLTVVSRFVKPNDKNPKWVCRCDCGNTSIVQGGSLKNGRIKSCGCLNIELTKVRNLTHGKSVLNNGARDRTYQTWQGMIQRCHNEKHPAYKWYGGRGLCVCDRWRKDFLNFFDDMGERPNGFTIERKNNAEGYHPNNCIWATREEQSRNKRNVKLDKHKINRIREFVACGISRKDIAQTFNITVGHVGHIVNMICWVNVDFNSGVNL